MFEIVTLNAGRTRSKTRIEEMSRAARPMRAGKVNSVQSVRTSAPIRDCWDLASDIAAEIVRRRSTGSATSVASEVSMAERRLPALSLSSSARTEIGTKPTRGSSGSSPRASRYRRSAPAQSASTTSLTVHPKWFFTAFRSSRRTSPNATRRCGVIARLNEVLGALKGERRRQTPGVAVVL